MTTQQARNILAHSHIDLLRKDQPAIVQEAQATIAESRK
jgi:hypothetical protein